MMVITEKGDEQSIRRLVSAFDIRLAAETRVECGYEEVKEKMEKIYWSGECCDPFYADRLKEALDQDDIAEIRAVNREIELFDDISEQGEGLEGYNPRGRLDFYGIGGGGRWGGLLNGKPDCRLADFPRIREGETESTLAGKYPILHGKWRKEYEGRPGSPGFADYLIKYASYALATPEGECHEPGTEANWYGPRINPPEKGIWTERFNRILDSYPQDWYVTLVDCHI